jgi:DegV family protein with EDD domain
VVVVDGGQVSIPLGLLCLFAARMAARGLSAQEVAARIEALRSRVHSLFVVDTLEYLARGGRIGRARAVLGGLLRIKPILGVIDGEVTAVDRARGGRAAQLKMVELFKGRVDVGRPVVLLVAHAAAPVWAERLQTLLSAAFQVSELIATEMGPVVGTHAGPGTVGAALFQAESGEETDLTAPLPG